MSVFYFPSTFPTEPEDVKIAKHYTSGMQLIDTFKKLQNGHNNGGAHETFCANVCFCFFDLVLRSAINV